MATSSSEEETRPGLHRDESSEDAPPYFMRPRTEAARERDVFRYLHPWAEANQPAFMTRPAFPDHRETPEPEACPDITLAALAQLGALRMGARRAIVSLISCTVEYVLAEATRSMSLQYDVVEDPKDAPWLGTCSFDRAEGVNGHALDCWRKARHLRQLPDDDGFYYTDELTQHSLIIGDMRCRADLQQRSFVQRAPWLRFYCSVPLRDRDGSVIGSYAILDDKPRYGLSANELTYLEDMADTTTDHLEATIIRAQRQRSERLIRGLTLFNGGKDSLRQWWLTQDDRRLIRAGRYRRKDVDRDDQNTRLAREFGVQEHRERSMAARQRARRRPGRNRDTSSSTSDNTPATAKEPEPESETGAEAPSVNDDTGQSGSSGPPSESGGPLEAEELPRNREGSRDKSADLSANATHAYARATNLIREALHAEGVYFVDASSATANVRLADANSGPSLGRSESTGSESATNSERHPSVSSETDLSDRADTGDRPCRLNGFSSRKRSTLKGTSSDYRFNFPEHSLTSLIRRYPRGQIFNYEDSGDLIASSGDDGVSSGSSRTEPLPRPRKRRRDRDAENLGRVMPGARSIAFFPVWDSSSERYRTCLFVWSMSPLRYFDPSEDITYLAAFSHSLLAELGRMETMASDKAKSTFISSMSHELRSPLHGVLAGAEFLLEGDPTAWQEQMISTISMAGRTLLDTVENILDYSKITNFSKSQRRDRAKADASRHEASIAGNQSEMGVTMCMDLARLTEEVVETVTSACRFKSRAQSRAQFQSPSASKDDGHDQHSLLETNHTDAVSITLDIGWRKSWIIDIAPGSWTRILTNLVSNALKYTPKGNVSVKLCSGNTTKSSQGQERCDVTLIVQDTGIGMSPTFLSQGLYTPFKQVDSHSSGTGLGLSIVKQIVHDIGAHMNVASELGKGTRVSIVMSAHFSEPKQAPEGASIDAKLLSDPRIKDLRRFHLYRPEDHTLAVSLNRSTAILESVHSLASQWLSCEITSGSQLHMGDSASILAFTEDDLAWLISNDSAKLTQFLAQGGTAVILAASLRSISTTLSFDDASSTPLFISQAIGPRKLLRSIIAARDPAKSPRQPVVTSRKELDAARPDSSLPNHPVSSERPATVSGPALGESTDRPEKVLLVEDNDVNMKLLVALMKKLKLSYECATNGREALDVYSNAPANFFLIMMDISMPVMDGVSSTLHIRETEKRRKLARCTIVAITGVTSSEERHTAMRSGVDRVFAKPIRMADLSALVKELKT